jgi:hypothetical protein
MCHRGFTPPCEICLTLANHDKYSLGHEGDFDNPGSTLFHSQSGVAMPQNNLDHSDGAAVVPYQRRDVRQKDIVDLGIALQQRSNTMSALEYLRSQEVANEVIERVLTEPGRRRSWQF